MMKAAFAFVHAALPWVVIGLLLAVFFARAAHRKKEKETYGDYGTEGMCLGMCLGSAIGSSGAVNIGIGLPLGMLIGLAIGTCIKKETRGEDNDETE